MASIEELEADPELKDIFDDMKYGAVEMYLIEAAVMEAFEQCSRHSITIDIKLLFWDGDWKPFRNFMGSAVFTWNDDPIKPTSSWKKIFTKHLRSLSLHKLNVVLDIA